VVLFAYRHHSGSLFARIANPTGNRSWLFLDPRDRERREFWLQSREGTSALSEQERKMYESWSIVDEMLLTEAKKKLPDQGIAAIPVNSIAPLFFTVSAKISNWIDQGISELWADLAGQFMLQAAMESLRNSPASESKRYIIMFAFARGWIPAQCWDDFETDDDTGVEAEVMINAMFEDENSRDPTENQKWQETRLRCLSLFDLSKSDALPPPDRLAARLAKISKRYPVQKFEEQLMAFMKAMWEFCRKPLLLQIQEGKVEGMTAEEFEEFKRNALLPT
jgi:hypothetical protein